MGFVSVFYGGLVLVLGVFLFVGTLFSGLWCETAFFKILIRGGAVLLGKNWLQRQDSNLQPAG